MPKAHRTTGSNTDNQLSAPRLTPPCAPRCKVCRASLDAVRTALARPANAAARPVGALALEVCAERPRALLACCHEPAQQAPHT